MESNGEVIGLCSRRYQVLAADNRLVIYVKSAWTAEHSEVQ